MNIILAVKGFTIGNPGSDAGFWWIGPDGRPHHVGGWGETAMAQVGAALTTLGAAAQIQDRALQTRVLDVVQAMLKPHLAYLANAGTATQTAAQ